MGSTASLTDEHIETIRATYAMTGKYSEAAKAAGVSLSSAYKYAKLADDLEELRNEKRAATIDQIIVKCGEVQTKLLEALVDPVKIAKASMQECATAFGIVTDKRQLLSGQATERSERIGPDVLASLTPEEKEQAARIREKMARAATPV